MHVHIFHQTRMDGPLTGVSDGQHAHPVVLAAGSAQLDVVCNGGGDA